MKGEEVPIKNSTDGTEGFDGFPPWVVQDFRDRQRDAIDKLYQAKSQLRRPKCGHTGFPFDPVGEVAFAGSSNEPNENSSRREANHSSNQEYKIDPITNRKVYKNTTNKAELNHRKPIDVPVKTFKGYRSQFSDLEPPTLVPSFDTYNFRWAPWQSKIRSNQPLNTDHADSSKNGAKESDAHASYDQRSRVYTFGLQANERKKPPKENSEVSLNAPYRSDRRSSAKSKLDPVQEGLKAYDAKVSYDKPFLACEPDGKYAAQEEKDTIKEGLKPFDDQMSYDKPFLAYEPDGQPPVEKLSDPVQEGLRAYDSKVSYNEPFMAYEPDGQPPQEEKPNSVWESVTAYEPNTKVPEADPTRESLKAYERKHPYPESQSELETPNSQSSGQDFLEEGLKKYDNRHSYGPVYYNEPFGKPSGSVEAFVFSNPSQETNSDCNSASKITRRQMLDTAFDRQEGVFKQTIESQATLQRLRDSARDARIRADAKAEDAQVEQPTKTSSRKMTGNFVRDFPEEFETKWTSSKTDSGTLVPEGVESIQQTGSHSPEAIPNKGYRFKTHGDSKHYVVQGIEFKKPSLKRNDQKIQSSLDRYRAASGSTLSGDETNTKSTQKPSVRDGWDTKAVAHPGEGDLSTLVSSYGKAKEERDATGHDASEGPKATKKQGLVSEVRSIYEDTYGTIDCNHRQNPKMTSTRDVNSSGLNIKGKVVPSKDDSESPTHVFAARGEAAMEGAEGTASRTSSDATPLPEVSEPTIYKILAYDPIMQSVSIAETTSIVTDTASALTPAEVIERLSNPAKFFPHFEPLSSQGYEIVSGSGDVLVFRKVRSAIPPPSNTEPPPPPPQEPKRTSTNPIDGMQSTPIAATGNFASPTGFVNHDLPPRVDPPFKSNIDVRREEPVFSGKRNWYDEDELPRRKTGRGRRVVTGAVWVGAFAYAVGVVAEYFKTGGEDGLGPAGSL